MKTNAILTRRGTWVGAAVRQVGRMASAFTLIATMQGVCLAQQPAAVGTPDATASDTSDLDASEGTAPGATIETKGAAAEGAEPTEGPLQYIAPKTIEMLVGVRIQTTDGNMIGTLATTVLPTPWPEQTVEIVEVNMPSIVKHSLRDLPGGNQQLLLTARMIPAHNTVDATVRVRIEKRHIVGPTDTTGLKITRRLPRDVSNYLGNSPYIEVTSSEIRKIVREIEATDPLTDWQMIERMYDWVRENIVYQRGDLKTVRDALRDRTGDCEEMTGTFVALCRAARIPARCVWIPNHCYPEFYLEDESGQGYWFPCQVAGTRNFGSMPEYLPILQKGDRFKVPEKSEQQRYLADYLISQRVTPRGDPQVEFVCQLLGDAATLRAPDLDAAAAEPTPDN